MCKGIGWTRFRCRGQHAESRCKDTEWTPSRCRGLHAESRCKDIEWTPFRCRRQHAESRCKGTVSSGHVSAAAGILQSPSVQSMCPLGTCTLGFGMVSATADTWPIDALTTVFGKLSPNLGVAKSCGHTSAIVGTMQNPSEQSSSGRFRGHGNHAASRCTEIEWTRFRCREHTRSGCKSIKWTVVRGRGHHAEPSGRGANSMPLHVHSAWCSRPRKVSVTAGSRPLDTFRLVFGSVQTSWGARCPGT